MNLHVMDSMMTMMTMKRMMIIVMVSLGMTADLIGEETSSSALVFGLMSLTDKVGFCLC